jgi:hypothetical protein
MQLTWTKDRPGVYAGHRTPDAIPACFVVKKADKQWNAVHREGVNQSETFDTLTAGKEWLESRVTP